MNSIRFVQKTILALSVVAACPQALAISPGAEAFENASDAELSTVQKWHDGKPACSNKTLKGTYTYQFEGTRDDGKTLTREAGMEVYDGEGTMSVIASFNSVPGSVYSFQTTQLTYVVNANCTGVLSGKSGPYADIFVAPDGSSFTFVSNVAGHQISGVETRVSKKATPIIP